MTTTIWLAVFSFALLRPSDLIGKWVHHEKWKEIPAEGPNAEKNGPTWAARALVLHFCADGTFIKIQGALYRGRTRTELGSNDGLEIWRGTWQIHGAELEVRFRLVEAEIPFTGMAEAMRVDTVARGRIRGKRIELDLPAGRRIWTTLFAPAADLPSPLSDRFLQCKPSSAKV